jgi:hypothetical protein
MLTDQSATESYFNFPKITANLGQSVISNEARRKTISKSIEM